MGRDNIKKSIPTTIVNDDPCDDCSHWANYKFVVKEKKSK